MPERERKQKPAPKERVEKTAEVAAPRSRARSSRKSSTTSWTKSTASWKTNAEEFVKSYVQKGRRVIPNSDRVRTGSSYPLRTIAA